MMDVTRHAFLTRYSYAVGAFGTVIVCRRRLSVTDVLWLNGGR